MTASYAVPGIVPLAEDRPSARAAPDQLALPLQWTLPSGVPALLRTDGAPVDRPDPQRWAGGLVQSLLEVLAGARPPLQVMRWLDTAVYDELRRVLSARPRRRTAPGTVRSVHVCRVDIDIAEVSVVVAGSGRARAVALRLEGVSNRWRCTRLAIL